MDHVPIELETLRSGTFEGTSRRGLLRNLSLSSSVTGHRGFLRNLSLSSAGVGHREFLRNLSLGSSGAGHRGFLRNSSFSSSGAVHSQIGDEVESDNVSESGDIGDRALHYNRCSESGRLIFPASNEVENGGSVSILEDAVTTSGDQKQENKEKLPWLIDYISCLIHLAVFGILGVLTRYLLQKLFGPGVVDYTSNQRPEYLDLPSNMVGSFLMGWWGIVFKQDISKVSDLLAVGLTTGYLGSVTTFSGWNQKMLDLSIEGRWVFVVLGFVLGMFLVGYSIIFGVETAKAFKRLLKRLNMGSKRGIPRPKRNWHVDSWKRHIAVMVVLVLMLGLLWGVSWTLEGREFSSGGSSAELWLACMVAPLGVWIRWWLARFNGRGLGRADLLKWVPFGTLIANVSAACIMAALATMKKAVKTKNCDTVATGVQFGLLGCLSTVSTFMAEFHTMRESKQPWRAYAYATITIVTSFVLGTLIYSVPVWNMWI